MPCRDDYPDTFSQNQVDAAVYRVRQELEPLLCEACSLLIDAGELQHATPELQNWFQKHEKCEEDRVRLEAAQKLSERERRLLGIDVKLIKKRLALKKKK